MAKTFREVIRDIKVGEVWKNESEVIECSSCGILITRSEKVKGYCMGFPYKSLYTLERPQFTFTEAFAEYEKGVEIESVESGGIYKYEEEVEKMYNEEFDRWSPNGFFSTSEIRNKWYINK